jgi:hypothetical protein
MSAGCVAVPTLALAVALAASGLGLAQGRCALVPDDRSPSQRVLRCGEQLTIRSAPNTRWRLASEPADGLPTSVQLDVGALLIEFKPSETRRSFQILTPHAIAAVRGTTWAMEVEDDMTSTLVVLGFVEVRRPNATRGSLLRAGQGADVVPGSGPVIIKRWPRPRVDALLARFGN